MKDPQPPQTDGNASVKKIQNPYIGLRPYKESESAFFYGRDTDRKILVDLILASRFTLLFAASGVGKSSLLQAAVLPQLKDPHQENLDAVYCNNWAGDPLLSIRSATLEALGERGRIDAKALTKDLGEKSLLELFELCCHFVRQPLILVFDQFEEFFHYHRSSPSFPKYRQQLVELITNQTVPVSIVLSMREDFALSLNAFKPELPTVLFNNFYRLEKLPPSEARTAIVNPAAQVGFRFEPGLVEALLTDLSAREHSARPGAVVSELALHIEPPYLQIVCSQLFELDAGDPERTLRLQTYKAHGSAAGLLASYIGRVTSSLTYPERKLASHCFSFLVTRRGTKVAHTAQSLANEVRVSVERMQVVLEKLEHARLLRKQAQEPLIWYELYHDLFSDSIEVWNERFKQRERLRRTLKTIVGVMLSGFALYATYNAVVNTTSSHLRLSLKADPTGQVEVYRGKADTWDPFALQRYQAEAGIEKQSIEPDLLFVQKPIADLSNLDETWAERLPTLDRMDYFRDRGKLGSSLKIAKGLLSVGSEGRAKDAIQQLTLLHSRQGYQLIEEALRVDSQRRAIATGLFNSLPIRTRTTFQDGMGAELAEFPMGEKRRSRALEDFLVAYLTESKNPQRSDAAERLGLLRVERALPAVVDLLVSDSAEERRGAAKALGYFDREKVVDLVQHRYPGQRDEVQLEIVDLLIQLGGASSQAVLVQLLKNASVPVRVAGLEAVRKAWPSEQVATPFLSDPDIKVVLAAIGAFGFPGPPAVLKMLRQRETTIPEPSQRINLKKAVDRLDPSKEAEQPFADVLRSRLSIRNIVTKARDDQCVRLSEDLRSFGNSERILEQALRSADERVGRILIRCMPEVIWQGKIALLSSLTLTEAPSLADAAGRRLLAISPEAALHTALQLAQRSEITRQSQAIDLLAQLRNELAWTALAELAARTGPGTLASTRLRAIQMLGQATPGVVSSQTREQIAASLRTLARGGGSSDLRKEVPEALVRWLGDGARQDLLALLADPEEAVRTSARNRLLELRSPLALAELRKAAQQSVDSNELSLFEHDFPISQPEQFVTQAEALKRLLQSNKGSLSNEQSEVKQRFLQLARSATRQDISWLWHALSSSNQDLQSHVLNALGDYGQPRIRELLHKYLENGAEEKRRQSLLILLKLVRNEDLSFLREHLQRYPQDQESGRAASLVLELGILVPSMDRGCISFGLENRVADYSDCGNRPAKAALMFKQTSSEAWRGPRFPESRPRPTKQLSTLDREVLAAASQQKAGFSNWALRYESVRSLQSLATPGARMLLTRALDDSSGNVAGEAARTLASLGDSLAVPPILQQLNRTALRDWQRQSFDNALAWLDPPRFARSNPALWPILAADCDASLLPRFKSASHLTEKQRIEVAKLLMVKEKKCSAQILLPLANDPSSAVREAAARALGVLSAQAAVPALHQLLNDTSVNVQRATGESLAKHAGPESLALITAKINDEQTPLYVVVPLVYALGHIGTPDAMKQLLSAALRYQDSIGWHAYRLLGDLQSPQVIPELKTHLTNFEEQVRSWRADRDRARSDSATDGKNDKTRPQRPNSLALVELVTTLARLAQPAEVLQLLRHDLSDVRQAAALGLAARGRPEVVELLDTEWHKSQDVLFRHAAYRTIDMTLEMLQARGNEADLSALKAMLPKVKAHADSRGKNRDNDRDSVLMRLEYTIDELGASLDEQARPTAAEATRGK